MCFSNHMFYNGLRESHKGGGKERLFNNFHHFQVAMFKICIVWILMPPILALGCTKIPKGRVTFDSEGNDNPQSRYFSRVPHVPSRYSGITIGRGYDLGGRSSKMAYRDLCEAGINTGFAESLSDGVGLIGLMAKLYLKTKRLYGREITWEQQCNLFVITYQEEERITIRVVQKYTSAKWYTLLDKIQQILVDLKYRGDLLLFMDTPGQRALKNAIEKNKLKTFRDVMENRTYWKNVPMDRFKRRIAFLNA